MLKERARRGEAAAAATRTLPDRSCGQELTSITACHRTCMNLVSPCPHFTHRCPDDAELSNPASPLAISSAPRRSPRQSRLTRSSSRTACVAKRSLEPQLPRHAAPRAVPTATPLPAHPAKATAPITESLPICISARRALPKRGELKCGASSPSPISSSAKLRLWAGALLQLADGGVRCRYVLAAKNRHNRPGADHLHRRGALRLPEASASSFLRAAAPSTES